MGIGLMSLMVNSCSEDDTSDYFVTGYTLEDGIDLFDEDARNVILTDLGNEKEIEFSAGHEVTFCWITSQEPLDCAPGKLGGDMLVIVGDSYYPESYVGGYQEGELISDLSVYPWFPAERFVKLSGVDWSSKGVEIIDTHANKDIPYDNCEFVYLGWLQVTLGGEDEEHRFIRLKSVAEAPEGYETAHLYFNPAYKFVNNMITVTQRGYASAE